MKHYSVFTEDKDVLLAFDDIFTKGKWFDADITYSKGVFYKGLKQPNFKSDLLPQSSDVVQDDATELKTYTDSSLNSIIFDPPFLFRNRKSDNNDKISKRFSYFKSFDELLEMYAKSLQASFKKLRKGGHLFFKCQDMTDGKFYCTHYHVIKLAEDLGFTLKDIAIKSSNKKLQRDAVQQNCLAKTHSYWIVFKK